MKKKKEKLIGEGQGVTENSETLLKPQKTLQASKKTAHSIIERIRDGIMLTDEKGIVIEWNRPIEQIFRLPKEKIVGKPVWFVAEKSIGGWSPKILMVTVETYIKRVLKTGKSSWLNRTWEGELTLSNGEKRSIQLELF